MMKIKWLSMFTMMALLLSVSLVHPMKMSNAQDSAADSVTTLTTCGVTETPLNLGDPFAADFNPQDNSVTVIRAGTSTPQAAILRNSREVARILFPTEAYAELTSLGVNAQSGITYITQWKKDTVYFVEDAKIVGQNRTGYWGPALVWPNPYDTKTFVGGKWVSSPGTIRSYASTAFGGQISIGSNSNPNGGVIREDGRLYLVNSNTDTVSLIGNGSLLATINVGDHPNGIAFNPKNGYVYAVNRGTSATESTVSVISETTVISTIVLGPGYDAYLGVNPKDAITLWGNTYSGGTDIAAVDPNTGTVYISNWGADSVSVIDGTTLVATVPVGTDPNSILYNPITKLIYVANTGDDTVTVINGTVAVATLRVGDYPIDLTLDTRTGFVHVVNRLSDSLSTIRCDNAQDSRLVLGHLMTWYMTPQSYGQCINVDARENWRMWNLCDHDPNVIDANGYRDIAALNQPLIGLYDSADPNVIEYQVISAVAAGIDGYIIDYYGEADPGGIDDVTQKIFLFVEEMNEKYGTDFKIALMYDEGALADTSDRVGKATQDFDHIINTYTTSSAYLWADGMPVLYYFPKGPVLSPTDLQDLAEDFFLIAPDFANDFANGSYAWVKADPEWEEDGSNWGKPYLDWYYPTFDWRTTTVPTLTLGVGAVWPGFNDEGVGANWSCTGKRLMERQDGYVLDATWEILDTYNASVGISYTTPITWVQLITLNDFMEGTELMPTVEDGYQYMKRAWEHIQRFKDGADLATDEEAAIFVAQHIFNARLHSQAEESLIDRALGEFFDGRYMDAIMSANAAAELPIPTETNLSATQVSTDTLRVIWREQEGKTPESGYQIHYGTVPGVYGNATDVLTDTAVLLTGLSPDTYYIAVTTAAHANPCEEWYISHSWYSEEMSIRVEDWSTFQRLTVASSGQGKGTVSSEPSGIDCGGGCTEIFPPSTVVTLTAVADADSIFVDWGGACSGNSGCILTMDSAQEVTATFDLKTYPLDMSKLGDGDGVVTSSPSGINCGVDCKELFAHGTVVTLTVVADADSIFVGWGGACSGYDACTVIMDSAQEVTASFDLRILDISKLGDGDGVVTSTPSGIDCGDDCTEVFPPSTVVTLTAVADADSIFVGWGGACSGYDACTVTMDKVQKITASFAEIDGRVYLPIVRR